MAKSINGWTVLVPGSSLLSTKTIPGTTRRITMRRSVLPLFLALAYDYDDWLRSVDKGPLDDAGYAYRQARAANDFSNHASGTALDLNWRSEGAQGSAAGKAFFEDPEHRAKIEWLKTLYQVVDWGGDWRARDYMHWELSPGTTQAQVDAVIKHLGIGPLGVRHNDAHGKPLKDDRDGQLG